jgi:DNA-binding NarL/FixJ family response regulator
MKTRVFILDDDADALNRLEFLIKEVEGFSVCGLETNPKLAVSLIKSLRPDLIFLDIEMPVYNGFEVLDLICSSSFQPVVVFVTAYDKYAIEAIKASAFDYILKPVDPNELIQSLAKYEVKMHSDNQNDISGLEKLTNREKEILYFLQQGQSSKQIASVLKISRNTVDTHRRRILKKLGCSSTAEILRRTPVT